MEKPIFTTKHYTSVAQYASEINSPVFTNLLVDYFKAQPNFNETKFREYVAKWTVRRLLSGGPDAA